jgi:hypothetical protein
MLFLNMVCLKQNGKFRTLWRWAKHSGPRCCQGDALSFELLSISDQTCMKTLRGQLQSYCTVASELLHCSFRAFALVLQSYFTVASELLHCCFRAIVLFVQSYCTGASELLHCCFRAIALLLQSYCTVASMLLHYCFRAILLLLLLLHSYWTVASELLHCYFRAITLLLQCYRCYYTVVSVLLLLQKLNVWHHSLLNWLPSPLGLAYWLAWIWLPPRLRWRSEDRSRQFPL